MRASENSEVFPVVSFVAVAVIACPTPTLLDGVNVKLALPLPSVVMDFSPMNFLPSSLPEGLEKNWIW